MPGLATRRASIARVFPYEPKLWRHGGSSGINVLYMDGHVKTAMHQGFPFVAPWNGDYGVEKANYFWGTFDGTEDHRRQMISPETPPEMFREK